MKDTKQNVLESAYFVTAENGLENVTTKKIATKAKVSESIMYRYFVSKDEILSSAFGEINNDLNRLLAKTNLDETESKEQEFSRLWNAFISYFLKNPVKIKFFDLYRHSGYDYKKNGNLFEKYLFENFDNLTARIVLSVCITFALNPGKSSEKALSKDKEKAFSMVKNLLNI